MRGPILVSVVVLVAGCVGAQDTPGAPATPSFPAESAPPAGPAAIQAPELPIGRAWTYSGTQQYNPDAEFVVVVARVDAGGYLFAGGSEDDLVYDALWGNPMLGPHDLHLNRLQFRKLLDFPLEEGKSWQYSDSLTLTARMTDVRSPHGLEPGSVIEGANDVVHVRAEYAPSVGNIVSLKISRGDLSFDDLRMTRVEEGRPWTWHELGALTVVPTAQEPAAFEVPEGFDAVIASAGGRDGARALLRGPGGEWSIEFTGDEAWHNAMLPATQGTWVAEVVGWPYVEDGPEVPVDAPVGWAYMHVAPVRWLRGG